MTSRLVLSLLIMATVALVACASGGGGEGGGGETKQAEAEAKAAMGVPPPANSPLAKVKNGMSDAQVRTILGDPDNANAYTTGKAWIPYYYGPDTHRTDWMYKGMGRVVFSRNRYSGSLKVIRIDYNPKETAGL